MTKKEPIQIQLMKVMLDIKKDGERWHYPIFGGTITPLAYKVKRLTEEAELDPYKMVNKKLVMKVQSSIPNMFDGINVWCWCFPEELETVKLRMIEEANRIAIIWPKMVSEICKHTPLPI